MKLTLVDTCPELLKEWDYTYNTISPNEVSNGSHKKVWWKCSEDENHVWESSIRNRVKGSLCPYCSGKKASNENCLAELRSDLAKEWHPSLNKGLTPYDVTLGSSKKVWWQCAKNSNHIWESVIQNRVATSNCPYCTKKRASNDYCLANINPRLASEWHPFLNKSLTPFDVTPASKKKVWWQCKNNPNHEWLATLCNRNNGSNCPYCMASTQTSFPELSIYYYLSLFFKDTKNRINLHGTEVDVYIPQLKLAIEYDGWYYHKNNEEKDKEKNRIIRKLGIYLIRIREKPLLKIDDYDVINLFVNKSSDKDTSKVIKELIELIKAIFGNNSNIKGELSLIEIDVVEDRIKIMNQIDLKKKKENLSVLFPELAKEWHPSLNGKLLPEHLSSGSSISVWWHCKQNSLHIWKAVIGNRVRGDGCPFCSNKKVCLDNCLAKTHPNLVKEWHPSLNKNLTPYNVTQGSHKQVWWQCKKNNNHIWKSSVKTRLKSPNCPFCIGKRVSQDNCLAITNPILSQEWHPTLNGELSPTNFTSGSSKKVWWVCKKNIEHVWEASIYNRNIGEGCPYCSGKRVSGDNCLAIKCPKVAGEWHPTLNGALTPFKVVSKSNQKVWWLCKKNKNHQWQATIASRVHSGVNCPFCAGKKASSDNCLSTIRPDVAEEWHSTLNGELSPFNVTHGSKKKVWWQCRCNKEHIWQATINNRVANNSGCPICKKEG